jgi:hypothetical protein
VYLWDINVSVALPVVLVTLAATLVYLSATILPLIDKFCPYTTASHKMIVALSRIVPTRQRICAAIQFLEQTMNLPKWLKHTLGTFRELDYWQRATVPENSTTVDEEVQMTDVTSQMLSWLITNCEDSRSVDAALQAVSGANQRLPIDPLVECHAPALLLQRFDGCFQQDQTGSRRRLKNSSLLPVAVLYSRATSLIMSSHATGWGGGDQPSADAEISAMWIKNPVRIAQNYAGYVLNKYPKCRKTNVGCASGCFLALLNTPRKGCQTALVLSPLVLRQSCPRAIGN